MIYKEFNISVIRSISKINVLEFAGVVVPFLSHDIMLENEKRNVNFISSAFVRGSHNCIHSLHDSIDDYETFIIVMVKFDRITHTVI